ncbi:MAG TPA: rhomboid family intramembrane serine protease [Kofleriaceae bacterium]|nr:rhomboid family intramembrane serine protease [Kofleriaceae bacterium]
MTVRRRIHCDFPWTLAVGVLAVVATAVARTSPRFADAVVADGRIAHGQLWRALTGPFVHATWGHLVRDLALVALAGVAYEAALRSRRALLFAGGLAFPAIAVLAAGDARWYCGLSGLSHALLAAALSYELVSRRGIVRALVAALCAVSAVKPIYEVVTGAPAFAMSLGPGVVQVPRAHAVGVLLGIACGLLAALDRRRGSFPPRCAVRAAAAMSAGAAGGALGRRLVLEELE